jgi:hypothetical protein
MLRPRLRVSGAGDVALRLGYAGERVKDGARKAMHRGADKIVKEARLNTPVDKGNLEASIVKDVNYVDRGRLQIEVVVGGFVGGVNVDEYAAEVHENYDDENPGPRTALKREANPGRLIGSKFLERAIEDNREKIEAAAIAVIEREWYL